MAKYGKKAQNKVGKVMHEYKHGELKSGGNNTKVKSRKQAIAIGLSEARKEGDKVPPRKSSSKKTTAKKSASKKSTASKATPKAKSQRGAVKRKTNTARRKKAASKK